MTALTWNNTSNPRYEAGVDRGVVYPPTGPGVVWNGLISVDEQFEGGEVDVVRFDGIAIGQDVLNRSFLATINAFAIPRALESCIGMLEIAPGFILTRQAPKQFGLSYRVQTSDSTAVTHLVYRATATPTQRGYVTQSNEIQPSNLSFQLKAVPEELDNAYPTAHFVLDPAIIPAEAMAVIEQFLYGTAKSDPRMPTLPEVISIIENGDFRSIQKNIVTGMNTLLDNQTTNLDLSVTSTPGLYTKMPDSRLYQSIDDPVGLNRME